ncbi:MAG TPA: hypothetical protein ENJ95_18195 [Bacteroidetes bacterium]|nr:hypothetical protein [Bacteroidota bacterium]
MKKLTLLLLLFTACQTDSPRNPLNVQHAGALKTMMHKGDLSAKKDLQELAGTPNLYALGAVENLKGEILIYDGQPLVTSVKNGTIAVDKSFDKKAALLVWAAVDTWAEVPVPSNVKSFEEFEIFIKKAAEENGLDTETQFPFLLDGTARSLTWHVINWKDGDTEHSHEKHIKSGLNGTLKNIAVNILGFYSKHHRTIYTHHTSNIHAHFKTAENPFAGHADDIELGENMVLKLPVEKYTLLENATLIDVNNLGKTENDISNACILLKNKHIEWAGKCSEKPALPDNTKIIDASGKYIMPGLFDGFAAINNQAYCNAYLYSGITSIISVDGGRRGPFFGDGNPSPNIYRLEGVGEEKIETDTLLAQIGDLHEKGFKVLLLMYGLTPDQLKLAIKKAAENNMATIGEMGYTTYKEGMDLGLDAIVHTTRYSLDVAPRDMAKAVADEPFSNDLNSPKWKYYKYLTKIKKDNKRLLQHAENIGKSNTFIIPTSSLSYLDLPEHKNPWKEPVAAIINIEDVNRPADPVTGNHSIDSEEQAAYTNLITNELANIEPTYRAHGAKYLAGSGTDVWGTMPGISLHTELWLLHNKIGLTNREVLAAATANFAEAYNWKNGKIEKRYAANILILNKNPLDDLENLKDIETVILNGRLIEREGLLK